MKREVRWSRLAEQDLLALVEFTAGQNPDAATRVGSAIQKSALRLGTHSTGRLGRTFGLFEKSVPGLPYLVAYEILKHADAETIVILRVIHPARDWPSGRWPKE